MSSPASGVASAPAKIILFGEHAVVYGQPALAVPVSSLRVTVTLGASRTAVFAAGDWTRALPADIAPETLTDPLLKMAQATAAFLGVSVPAARYEISSQIPAASGLGSGAAVAAAVGRAVALAAGRSIADAELNALVYEIERIHHGTPSGIDNTVIVYERPVYFVRGREPQPFAVAAPLHLLVADTGRAGLTKESVGDVRKLVENDPAFAQPRIERIGALVEAARTALSTGDIVQVGLLMGENHTVLRELTVSSPELDLLVKAAQDAGALGAKMSGGGRGGNMIALATPQTENAIAAALRAAGAVRVISTTVS